MRMLEHGNGQFLLVARASVYHNDAFYYMTNSTNLPRLPFPSFTDSVDDPCAFENYDELMKKRLGAHAVARKVFSPQLASGQLTELEAIC